MKPGLHQVEITLQTADALPTDDIRYLTFRVLEPRKILTVADVPAGVGALGGGLAMIDEVFTHTRLWRVSLDAKATYATDITTTRAFLELKPAEMASYEALVFAGLINPSNEVWDKASAYVESGGKLIVLPGARDFLTDGLDNPPPGYNNKLLPGAYKKWIETDFEKPGVTWAWDTLKIHGLLTDIREWVQTPALGLAGNLPQVWGYWEVEPRQTERHRLL